MYEAMAWLEGSALAETLRGMGIWTYGVVNLFHVLGISLLFGAIALLDLRLIGIWRSIPIAILARPTVPVAAIGLVLAVTTGIMMLSFNTTEYHGNPFLYVKLPMVVVGLAAVAAIGLLPAWRRARAGLPAEPSDRRVLRIAGALSLSIWLTVIACGRMIGYF